MLSETRVIEAVVFDMDGVLIDSEPIWRDVEREVFGRVGVELTDEDLAETMGVPIDEVARRWHRRRPWDGPSPHEIAVAVVDGMVDAIDRGGELNAGAEEAVDYFRGLGLRLALASSSPTRLIRAVVSKTGLDERFDVVHSAEDEDRGKPDPAVYLSAARKLGVAPGRCLAVEDSINGVRSAKSAGMVCIALPGTPPADATLGAADLVLDSLEVIGDRIWAAVGARPQAAGP